MEKFYAQVESFAVTTFRFFGIFPVFIHSKKYANIPAILLELWSLVLLFMVIVSVAFVASNEKTFLTRNSLNKANDLLKFGCAMVATCVIIFESLFNRSKFRKISKLLDCFDKSCKSLNVNFDWHRKQFTRNFARQFMFLMICQLICEIYIFLSSIWFEFYCANLFWAYACRFRHLQYIFILHAIRSKIIVLKNEMKKIVDVSKNKLSSRGGIVYQKTLEDLQTVKTAYGILWSLVYVVNETFSWSLTANLIQNFVQIGWDSYWFFIALNTKNLAKNEIRCFTIQFFSQVIPPLILIFLILNQANRIKVESARIPVQLHNIQKTNDSVDISEMVVKWYYIWKKLFSKKFVQIIHFSLQTVHQKISMRARSLFDVNNRLLISILSGIATYLVIC